MLVNHNHFFHMRLLAPVVVPTHAVELIPGSVEVLHATENPPPLVSYTLFPMAAETSLSSHQRTKAHLTGLVAAFLFVLLPRTNSVSEVA
jgi:hypothetical protein